VSYNDDSLIFQWGEDSEENVKIENVLSVIKQKFIDVKKSVSKNRIKPRRHTKILSGLGRVAQILCRLTVPPHYR
jgi:hypothetical protein